MNSEPAPPPLQGGGAFLKIVPPLSLPMRHFAFAALSFFAFSAALFLGSDRLLGWDFSAKWVLGLVHLLTLGWINMTILGALIQMIPVHGETPLAVSTGWIKTAWWAYVIGLIGFVAHLWLGLSDYWVPALLIAAAMGIYVYALAKTLLASPKRDWTGTHLLLAFAYLILLAVLGAMLAYDKQRGIILPHPTGAFIAHIHAALIGWVSLTIFGVSYRMVPFFSIARMKTRWPGTAALVLTNLGLLGLIADCLLWGGLHKPVWAAILVTGYGAYLYQAGPWASAAPRKWDNSLAFTVLALLGGLLWASLGLGLAFGWLEDSNETRSAYVFAALIGWATPFILGQIHKILPFLIWLHVYKPENGSPPAEIPKVDDITSKRLAWAEFAFMIPAIALGTGGFLLESQVVLQAGALCLVFTAGLFLLNTLLSLKHLVHWDPSRGPFRKGAFACPFRKSEIESNRA